MLGRTASSIDVRGSFNAGPFPRLFGLLRKVARAGFGQVFLHRSTRFEKMEEDKTFWSDTDCPMTTHQRNNQALRVLSSICFEEDVEYRFFLRPVTGC